MTHGEAIAFLIGVVGGFVACSLCLGLSFLIARFHFGPKRSRDARRTIDLETGQETGELPTIVRKSSVNSRSEVGTLT